MDSPTLIISPHLDDGVLSLGPLVHRWRRQGRRVTVLTVFSGAPDRPLSPAARDDRARYDSDPIPLRIAEDDAAAAVLDVETLRADLPELLFRWRDDGRPRCESLADIYAGSSPSEDSAVVEAVRTKVVDALRETRADRVFVPMGIGNHVDHVIARDGAERAAGAAAVSYYEDIPYILRGEHKQAPPDTERTPWSVNDDDVEAWLEATACYRTQLRIMFGEADWRAQFAEHARSGRAAYWRRTAASSIQRQEQ